MKASLLLLTGCAFASLAQPVNEPAEPVTTGGRAQWAADSTFGLPSLGAGVLSSAWGEAFHQPREYGITAKGFAQRYGLRMSGIVTSNAMEAGLGAIWGEDPRYRRHPGDSFGHRVGNVFKMSVMAYNDRGGISPAYARFAAIGGSNFLSNTWRPPSDSTVERATIRVGLGFLGRASSNAWNEFWPDVRDKLFRRQPVQPESPDTGPH